MFLLRLPFSLLLLVYQSAFLALGQIWSNKVRSILTTIGIVIGVASVTAVIGALTGLKTSVLADLESIGTNKLFIYPDNGGSRFMSYQRYRFHTEQFDGLLDHCQGLLLPPQAKQVGGLVVQRRGEVGEECAGAGLGELAIDVRGFFDRGSGLAGTALP